MVLAAHGYPQQPRQGDVICGLPSDAEDVVVFHAGTRRVDGQLLTSGGRVLCVTALGVNLQAARRRAYESVAQIRFDGVQYRTDIGNRGLPAAR